MFSLGQISKSVYHTTYDLACTSVSTPSSTLQLVLGLQHLSALLLWLSLQYYIACSATGYIEFTQDPYNVIPYSSLAFSIVTQDITSTPGIPSVTGLYHILLTLGFTKLSQISYTSSCLVLVSFLTLVLSIRISVVPNIASYIIKKGSTLSLHQISILGGLASIAWAGHLYHVSLPLCVVSSISTTSLLSLSPVSIVWFGNNLLANSTYIVEDAISLTLLSIVYHHIGVGIVIILTTCLYLNTTQSSLLITVKSTVYQKHLDLSRSLVILAFISTLISSMFIYGTCPYLYLITSYQSLLGLSVHHIWISSISTLGGASHLAIYYLKTYTTQVLNCQRDVIIGHLVWVTIFIGCHSFGIYVHNDTLYSLGYSSSTISDSTLSLTPLFGLFTIPPETSVTLATLSNKVSSVVPELGTCDYLLAHIHAFNIHVSLLIGLKGLLFSRTSRLVPDKSLLGFGYPCDGPGRGGTCQISPWDHIYLSSFWYYNTCSILVFGVSWTTSSYIWGSVTQEIIHLSNGDFTSSICVNSWLRDYLWTQSSQAIQSYGSHLGGYGYLFIGAHFLWSLSLMYLFSGRGYWQELIESLIWSHNKLNITPNVSPRALSITHGRLVGAIHYLLSGITVTWTYLLSRISVLTT